MGSEVHVQAGQTLTIKATARQNPDYGRLDRLELVVHGDVIKTVKAETSTETIGAETLELMHELQAQTSLWLAVRAYGAEIGLAHSAPVYVYVDGHKQFWKRAAVPELVTRCKNVLEEISSLEINWAAQHEKDSLSPEVLKLHWDAHREPLQARIKKALKFYDGLLVETTQ